MSEPSVKNANAATPRLPTIKLDPSLYDPTPEEINFLKSQTKVDNDEELKQHVLAVQRDAWAIVNYRCIQAFGFLTLKISRLPAYEELLRLGRERQDAIFLDFACCFGNDARKAVADGYPTENVLASDLVPEFWDLGHKLFKSSPETFPVPFVQGDVFDPKHLAPAQPLYSPPTTPRPVLSTLKSLTPLQGHVAALHVSAFFHLFGKEDQIKAAHLLASLMSPVPGSIIFGSHTSLPVSGERTLPGRQINIYCFCPKDWCALWDGVIFEKGTVQAEAQIVERDKWRGRGFETDSEETKTKRVSMVWCVRRI